MTPLLKMVLIAPPVSVIPPNGDDGEDEKGEGYEDGGFFNMHSIEFLFGCQTSPTRLTCLTRCQCAFSGSNATRQ